MTIALEPMTPGHGARIKGVDIRAPMDAATVGEIRAALAEHAVCVIGHDTPPTDEQHIAFSGLLGPMERGAGAQLSGPNGRVPRPEIIDQGNMDELGDIYADDDRRLAYKRANRLWHTDMSFYDNRATFSALVGHAVPPSDADTQFIDMREVWDALPESRKAGLEDLVILSVRRVGKPSPSNGEVPKPPIPSNTKVPSSITVMLSPATRSPSIPSKNVACR